MPFSNALFDAVLFCMEAEKQSALLGRQFWQTTIQTTRRDAMSRCGVYVRQSSWSAKNLNALCSNVAHLIRTLSRFARICSTF